MPKSVLKSTPDSRWFLGMTKINRINTLIPIPNSAHPKAAKRRMLSTLISRTKKKISPKNRHERDQEITVAETEKAIKFFENNKSPGNDGLSAGFYKTFNELLKKDISCALKIPNYGRCREACGRLLYPVCTKRRQRGHN